VSDGVSEWQVANRPLESWGWAMNAIGTWGMAHEPQIRT